MTLTILFSRRTWRVTFTFDPLVDLRTDNHIAIACKIASIIRTDPLSVPINVLGVGTRAHVARRTRPSDSCTNRKKRSTRRYRLAWRLKTMNFIRLPFFCSDFLDLR